jgi:hypothetical protein
MTVIHDFQESLKYSQSNSAKPWWEIVYRKAFKDFHSMMSVDQDGWAQRGGIDRVITLVSGKTLTVDEKVRRKDYGDILLEYVSNSKTGAKGWVEKSQGCDYLAYAFEESQRCYLFPFQELQRAWGNKSEEWIDNGVHRKIGFRIVKAVNRGYETWSVCVPLENIMNAIQESMCISWGFE